MPIHHHWPTEEEARRLAANLITGVATAPGEIAAAFLDPLTNYLCRRFQTTDPDMCTTTAEDAILATVLRRNHYDPDRLPLGAFLRMVAVGDLKNLLRKAARRPHGIPLDSVAEPGESGNALSEEDRPGWDDPRLLAEIATFAPAEQLALDLMRQGVRGTQAFAEAVGLLDVSPEELAATVKRFKDRLKVRLRRAVGGTR